MPAEPKPYWGDEHQPFVKIGTGKKELLALADAVARGASIAHAEITDLRALIEAVQSHPDVTLRPAIDADAISEANKKVTPTALFIKGGRVDSCDCSELDIRVTLTVSTRFGDEANFDGATFGERASFDHATFGERASFDEATFGDGASFEWATFGERASFDQATFGEGASFKWATFGEKADFEQATFGEHADFVWATFGEQASFDLATFGEQASFDLATFGEQASFDLATFGEQASFISAKLPRANFENALLRRANFRLAEIGAIDVSGADLVSARGLFGPHRATGGHLLNEHHVQTARFHRKWDWMPWTLLRVIGALRLFGVSYASIILIVLYVKLAEWYNTSFAVQVREDAQRKIDEGIDWRWREILANLPDLPVPGHLASQLIMILVLAIGATFYQLFCPDLVKEATETRWTRQMDQPLIEYRSAMWSRIVWRYLTALFLVIGGVYTVGYLSLRLWDALHYLFDH